MLFNSFEFTLFFLPATLAVFFLVGRRSPAAAAWCVGAASVIFLGLWDVRNSAVLIISICINYVFGMLINNQPYQATRRAILTIAISMNISTIFIFKYADFTVGSANYILHTNIEMLSIALPLGISFYTFTQIAFLVDVYNRKVDDFSPGRYLIFVTFFPHLIAGPILHHTNIMPAFRRPSTFRPDISNITMGIEYFTIGIAKKVLLADTFAEYASPVFSGADSGQAIPSALAWTAALAYTMQIYFDFSGYSDMAVGIAKMMNIDIPHNFNSPYKSRSIIEFWRRWHISLSAFLRDYVYIPLGGNKRGNRYTNLMATMLIGGLWHGASWTFVLWGGLHGAYLIANHALNRFYLNSNENQTVNLCGTIITFLLVVVAWVFFRAETFHGAWNILGGMFFSFSLVELGSFPQVLNGFYGDPESAGRILISLAIGFFICFLAPNTRELAQRLKRSAASRYVPIGAYGPTVFLLLAINSSREISEFIYYNF